MMRATIAFAVLALAGAVAEQPVSHLQRRARMLNRGSVGAPGAAPAAAPGGAPGGAPAPKDKFGADTHAEEFGNEYLVHEHKTVQEPNALEDKAWKSEMHTKLENFDPHGQDFLTDERSPASSDPMDLLKGAACPP